MRYSFSVTPQRVFKHTLPRFIAILALLIGVAQCAPVMAQNAEKSQGDLSTIMDFSRGFSKLMKSPKQENATNDDAESVENSSSVSANGGLPIPNNAGVVVRLSSLKELDAATSLFFKQTSDTSFSILASLRLTAYRSALACINTNSPAAIEVFCETVPPQIAVVLPVSRKQFLNFVNAVAKASKSDKPNVDSKAQTARFALTLNSTINLVAKQVSDDYVVVTSVENETVLSHFTPNNVSTDIATVPEELKSPIVTINVTELGLSEITKPDRPFWEEAKNALVEAQKSFPALADFNLDSIHKYVADNLSGVRYDLSIDDYGLYAALQVVAKPGSDADNELKTYRHPYPLNVDADRFFSVLPDVESTLAGQADLPASLSETLPQPLNRVSFVEYCLGLPADGELAAGSFLFYIEVDDADAFAREMIVPRAREVGRYIGSKQVGDAASQVFGGIAERRLARQNSSRRPVPDRRRADPERAAEVGNSLGSLLGGLIGESAGEESAMKEYSLNGYKMYVSDIETYTRQTALMKAEKEGRYVSPNASPMTNGAFSPVEALISVIQNDGALQRNILHSANEEAFKVDQTPLFAKEGYLVVLDKHTILYCLGNQDLLKLAINNYRSTKEPDVRYFAQTPDADTPVALNHLGSLIPDLRNTNIIGSTRIDAAASQAYYRWLQQYYFPNAPKLSDAELPLDTPKMLVVSSVNPGRSIQRFVLPHKTVSNLVATFSGGATLPELIFKPKDNASNDTEEDVDIDFGDE